MTTTQNPLPPTHAAPPFQLRNDEFSHNVRRAADRVSFAFNYTSGATYTCVHYVNDTLSAGRQPRNEYHVQKCRQRFVQKCFYIYMRWTIVQTFFSTAMWCALFLRWCAAARNMRRKSFSVAISVSTNCTFRSRLKLFMGDTNCGKICVLCARCVCVAIFAGS